MTAQGYYRRIYFEAIDLMMNAIDQWIDQPSFDTYAKMEISDPQFAGQI